MAKVKGYGTDIPQHEIESLARYLLPKIQAFFESEEGKREFEAWQEQHKSKANQGKLSVK